MFFRRITTRRHTTQVLPTIIIQLGIAAIIPVDTTPIKYITIQVFSIFFPGSKDFWEKKKRKKLQAPPDPPTTTHRTTLIPTVAVVIATRTILTRTTTTAEGSERKSRIIEENILVVVHFHNKTKNTNKQIKSVSYMWNKMKNKSRGHAILLNLLKMRRKG